jgi:hypothetical protein
MIVRDLGDSMTLRERMDSSAPATSLEVRSRLLEALKLALVGPGAGHALAEERLYRRKRPSNWYLTGFLIPSGTPPEQSADADEDDEFNAETAGLGHRREKAPDILKLRELHTAMDRAVLDAYGWSNVSTDCEFLLDYEIDEEEWGNKKKPWRYRWPDEVRDEVLARLLELNAERAKEEVRSGAAASKEKRGKGGKKRAAKASASGICSRERPGRRVK